MIRMGGADAMMLFMTVSWRGMSNSPGGGKPPSTTCLERGSGQRLHQ